MGTQTTFRARKFVPLLTQTLTSECFETMSSVSSKKKRIFEENSDKMIKGDDICQSKVKFQNAF